MQALPVENLSIRYDTATLASVVYFFIRHKIPFSVWVYSFEWIMVVYIPFGVDLPPVVLHLIFVAPQKHFENVFVRLPVFGSRFAAYTQHCL